MFANIYGAAGVSQMIEMMKTELTTSMALLGQSDIHQLNATNVSYLRSSFDTRSQFRSGQHKVDREHVVLT
jgi:isopentenyl diphosphate isomerase/L-lactate dehydrogenase-like FMN-dependent dehydrogenase